MCKYSYPSGGCANGKVESLDCNGEEKCEFSAMNVLTKHLKDRPATECSGEKWLGLYCERYKRFYCAGKDHCVTPESYMKKFITHQQRGPIRRMEP
jgi:hypothetical protein